MREDPPRFRRALPTLPRVPGQSPICRAVCNGDVDHGQNFEKFHVCSLAAQSLHRRHAKGGWRQAGQSAAGHPGSTPSTSSPQPSPPPTQHRRFWSSWLSHLSLTGRPKGKRRAGKKGRYNFYRVWEGKGQDVFYKWSDCKAAMKGCPELVLRVSTRWRKRTRLDHHFDMGASLTHADPQPLEPCQRHCARWCLG
jgi:hypothetical protein